MAQGMSPAQLARAREDRMARGCAALGRLMIAEWTPHLARTFPLLAVKSRHVVIEGKRRTRRDADPRRYVFLLPDGTELIATRKEFLQAHPEVNSGTLCDMVHGVLRQSKGIVFGGLADGEKDIDD